MAHWRRINRGANRLGLHKEQKIICSASLMVIELAYSLSCNGRKRKKIQYKMAAQWKDKRASSTTILSYYLSFEPTLDPPNFSLDPLFNNRQKNIFLVYTSWCFLRKPTWLQVHILENKSLWKISWSSLVSIFFFVKLPLLVANHRLGSFCEESCCKYFNII
jgi:hypothetical protein